MWFQLPPIKSILQLPHTGDYAFKIGVPTQEEYDSIGFPLLWEYYTVIRGVNNG